MSQSDYELQTNRLLTRSEAAHYLRVSVRTLDAMKASGEIIFVKMGGKVLFDRRDLDSYIEQCKAQLDGELIEKILSGATKSG